MDLIQQEKTETVANMLSRRGDFFDNSLDFPSFEDSDRFFNNAMRRYGGDIGKNLDTRLAQMNFNPRTDVSETPQALKLTMEIPGLKKEDLNVEVDEENKFLTLSGEVKQEKKEEKENFHRSERMYGSFKRSFKLPEHALLDNIKANLDHGVLCVTVPKDIKQQKQGKKISIQ